MTLHAEPPFDRATFSLLDRYTAAGGIAVVSGVQAIVRLLVEQHARDAARGLRTATFVSGYQGSPLGGLDTTLLGQRELLAKSAIHVLPALNEELAADAVWGSQLGVDHAGSGTFPNLDGVVGVWYGKAPGVDRACDALRHANVMGANPKGGVLVLAGDDPGGKSSTMPNASEAMLAGLQIPVLSPRDAEELVRFGLLGVELSRFTGCWVGLKITTDVADGLWTLAPFDGRALESVRPEIVYDGKPWTYTQYAVAAPPYSAWGERDLYGPRWDAVQAFIAANAFDAIAGAVDDARIGIVAPGKTYGDVCEALRVLGLDDGALQRHRIRLLRLGAAYPVNAAILARFARGLDEIVVVEEKRPFVEAQIRDRLYGSATQPRVVGKRDEAGRLLVPSDGELTAARVIPVLRARLGGFVDLPPAPVAEPEAPLALGRAPYFCSGCPHNRSTIVPEGSLAGGGIGCHSIVALMPRASSKVTMITQMGGEGAQWIGQAPFTDVPHLFQNMGDGTFYHSGQLAVQACIAAGVNITFKVLYNGAVAMTGGQTPIGIVGIPALAGKLLAEGVKRIIICTDDLGKYAGAHALPAGVEAWHRDRLDEAQRVLRTVGGVTVLVYDQHCATEARRLRKRGKIPDRTTRVVINERVCEGCGDCGVKSNCLSVYPVETPYGRKRRIDQASCNKDYTCVDGDCPSFVTVVAEPNKPAEKPAAPPAVAEPQRPAIAVDATYDVFFVGIGGTGVVTVNQTLATAAMADGLVAGGVDQTGLSQKAGTVSSHLRLARSQEAIANNRVRPAAVPALIVFDLLTGADAKTLAAADANLTGAAVSSSLVPTGPMVSDRNLVAPTTAELLARIERHARRLVSVDAAHAAEKLAGDAIGANFLLVGAAYQAGFLPISAESIEWAIGLNAVAVEMNVRAFRWGRASVAEPAAFAAELERRGASARPSVDLVTQRAADLVAYQGAALAQRYTQLVERAHRAEQAAAPGAGAFATAVATQLYRVLAYKDEYEVARLLTEPAFAHAVRDQLPNAKNLTYHLHPPLLRALGLKKKLALGGWFTPVLRGLYAARGLRGTPFDPFGAARVRRVERALIGDYEALVEATIARLERGEIAPADAAALAALPELIRGYESIKLESVRSYLEAVTAAGVSSPRVAALLAERG